MRLHRLGAVAILALALPACAAKVGASSAGATGAPPATAAAAPTSGPAHGAAKRPQALTGELAVEGPLQKRVSTAPADLVIFYGGEHKGSLETCGCPKRPRGSFARLDSYVDASRAANPGVADILVNAGYWLQDPTGLDGQLRPDAVLGNGWMVKGVRALGWDALNVGAPDLAALASLPPSEGPPLPLVSANVEGPGINRWVVVERGGLRIGITGVTAAGPLEVPGYTVKPVESAGAVLDALAGEADIVVLLAHQATESAVKLAAKHPAVDVVVDAAFHREWQDPFYTPANAVWVASHMQTMRLGELRLDLDQGRVVGGLGRQVDLDPEVPDDAAFLAMQKEARAALDVAQQSLYGP